ncbi:MAG: hypothetical protein ACI4UE_05525 [Candidatus Scatovivens sp.]
MEDDLNKENSKENKELIDVSSKKFVLGGKVITMSRKNEIQDIVGTKLSNSEIKNSIVVAVKENGEEKKEEKTQKNMVAKRIIPVILIPVLLAGMAHSCAREQAQTRKETTQVYGTIYQVKNPYTILEGIVNSAGQEGMTANAIEGYAFDGKYYSATEQMSAEERSSSGFSQFEQMQQEIDEKLETLTNETTTQTEKEDAARRLLKLSNKAKQLYEGNEDFAKEYSERFKEASKAYEDSNTENEIATVDKMVENYMTELGLSSENVDTIQQIVDAFEQGYELELEGNKEKDGDFVIVGEGVREVAVEEGVNKSAWQKFKDFMNGNRDVNRDNIDSFGK